MKRIGKIVRVTGSGRGLGRLCVLRLARLAADAVEFCNRP